jgi:cytochrome b561
MPLRNGPHGYGTVTKLLHWATVAALAAQLAVGYTMEAEDGPDCDVPGERRSGGDTTDAQEERFDRLEDACEARSGGGYDVTWGEDGWSLLEVHVLLGLLVLGLGEARVLWRARTPLPPWAEALSEAERRLEANLEKALVALLFVMPASGLLLVLGDDGWLPLHVASHVAFFAALALHVGLVLRHTVVRRERHLQRML